MVGSVRNLHFSERETVYCSGDPDNFRNSIGTLIFLKRIMLVYPHKVLLAEVLELRLFQ